MKRLIKLTLITILILINIRCEKNDDPVKVITVSDLLGDWKTESLALGNKVYTKCNSDLRKYYDFLDLNFDNVAENGNVIIYSNCSRNQPLIVSTRLIISDNKISIMDDDMIFEIQNAKTFDGSTLVIKLVTTVDSHTPVNGVYTLRHID